MRIVWGLLDVLLGTAIILVSLCFVISLCVLFFMMTGHLMPGRQVFFAMRAPEYSNLFAFQAISILVISSLFTLRLLFKRSLTLTSISDARGKLLLASRVALVEYSRPWKLCTFFLGTLLLVAGAFYYNAPDWDVPISLIMAFMAYLTAPWSTRVLLEGKWRSWPLMIFITWFSVDGCYVIYWSIVNARAIELMREANLPASLALYGLCGVLWLYRGSLEQFVSEIRNLIKK